MIMFAEWPSRWTHALHIFRFLLLLLFGRAKPMWSKKSLEPSNPAYLQMMSFMDLQFSRGPRGRPLRLDGLGRIPCQTLAWGILVHVTGLSCRV